MTRRNNGDTAPEDVEAIGEARQAWQAAVRIFTDVPTDDVWKVAKDYCNLDWCSMVTGCVLLEGEGNAVGTVRRTTRGSQMRNSWRTDYDGRNFTQLKGQQLPRGGSTEEENVIFMRSVLDVHNVCCVFTV
ncbi:hypothetical protein R1flu_026458 [Riccia fluitans]|uniref:Uncharacterized protein n=1 Tax=Riccia fluitans TaxID=41844 RepID=A0ABD1XGI2_9MARC